MQKYVLPVIAIAMAVNLAAAAPGALAQGDNENSGNHGQGQGPVKKIENALQRLQNFEVKNFGANDFARPTIPPSLTINPQGDVRITNGTVLNSVASSTLSVKIWGLTFTVNTDANTQVSPGGSQSGSVGNINTGDNVDVLGTTSDNTPGVIQAKVIHNRSAANQTRNDEISRLRQLINDLMQKLQNLLQTSTSTGSH